jgi:predicted GNAT family acetyltransferase
MRVISFDNPREFLDRTCDFLCEREAENNIILGNAQRVIDTPPKIPARMFTVVDNSDAIVAAAMQTPPHNLVLTKAPIEAVEAIADELATLKLDLPGVLAPDPTHDQFVAAWRGHVTDLAFAKDHEILRLYELDRVIPAPDVPGKFHQASQSDLELLIGWSEAFAREINHELSSYDEAREQMQKRLDNQQMFVWKDDGRIVTMAGWAGKTPTGVRINAVYTPQEFRRRGYATACVAALSQHLLDSGRRFCFLYTDRKNPTSNSIYQKIGYRPLCDWTSSYFRVAK